VTRVVDRSVAALRRFQVAMCSEFPGRAFAVVLVTRVVDRSVAALRRSQVVMCSEFPELAE
jgi:hypothetical protein